MRYLVIARIKLLDLGRLFFMNVNVTVCVTVFSSYPSSALGTVLLSADGSSASGLLRLIRLDNKTVSSADLRAFCTARAFFSARDRLLILLIYSVT